MKKLVLFIGMVIASLFMFSSTVSAQSYYDYDYDSLYDSIYEDYGYDNLYAPSPSDVGAFAFLSSVSLVVWCFLIICVVALYIFYSLMYAKIYEKNGLGDKKIFAFIPIANVYYLAIAAGEKDNAIVYALAPLAAIIPCVGWVVALVVMAILMMRVAKKMGRDEILGVFEILSAFIPVIGWIIGAFIMFHIAQGSPSAEKKA